MAPRDRRRPPTCQLRAACVRGAAGCLGIVLALVTSACLQRGLVQLARADDNEELMARIESHVATVHEELQEVFTRLCAPRGDPPNARVPYPSEQEVGDVNTPTCRALQDSGAESYYGHMNMLLVEAWLHKILRGLRLLAASELATLRPRAALLTVDDDGVLGGGIFVMQLLSDGALTNAAMMIGVHRMPRHKFHRAIGGQPPRLSVTNALVTRAVEWSRDRGFARLMVCPYAELPPRLRALGFLPTADPAPAYALGTLDMREDVCEEAALHVLELEPRR